MKLLKTRYSQAVQALTFVVSAGDTMVDTAGVTKDVLGGGTFDIADLPMGAVVVGGDIVNETAVSGGGASALTAALGDSASAARFAAAGTVFAAGARVPLVPVGYVGQGESARLTLANTGGTPTAGKVRVRVLFVIDGRANENL